MKTAEQKRREAVERQADHDVLSPSEKLRKLDVRLGPQVGARREREILENELAEVSTKKKRRK